MRVNFCYRSPSSKSFVIAAKETNAQEKERFKEEDEKRVAFVDDGP